MTVKPTPMTTKPTPRTAKATPMTTKPTPMTTLNQHQRLFSTEDDLARSNAKREMTSPDAKIKSLGRKKIFVSPRFHPTSSDHLQHHRALFAAIIIIIILILIIIIHHFPTISHYSFRNERDDNLQTIDNNRSQYCTNRL